MNIMINRPRKLVLLAVIAAGMLPAAAANAHWDCRRCAQPAPLYPYAVRHHHYHAVQHERPYAVELAPNIFAIPYRLPRYPYVSGFDGYADRGIINMRRIVRAAPVAVEDADVPRESGKQSGKQRVIRAEAEVTIVGPDRMNIRLFRKGRGRTIDAPAD
jgi:hypothetical protein